MKYILTDEQRHKLIKLLLADLTNTQKEKLHLSQNNDYEKRIPERSRKGLRQN